jgi:hypothetical protein
MMTRQHGNPNWGHHPIVSATAPTEFELQVKLLCLTTEMYASSVALRAWCEENKNRCYVPEWLLQRWGMSVDPNIAA